STAARPAARSAASDVRAAASGPRPPRPARSRRATRVPRARLRSPPACAPGTSAAGSRAPPRPGSYVCLARRTARCARLGLEGGEAQHVVVGRLELVDHAVPREVACHQLGAGLSKMHREIAPLVKTLERVGQRL